MSYEIVHAKIEDFCANYQGPLFHAMLADFPYHLTSITRRFGKEGSAPAQYGSDGAFQRASKGFMQKTWDGGDLAFRPETWAEIAKLLYPGAFLISYGSTRTHHRMAVAMEDAGLNLHPSIAWLQSQGMPKATRIDNQIDRAAGKTQPVVGVVDPRSVYDGVDRSSSAINTNWRESEGRSDFRDNSKHVVTSPVTDLAQAWAGHRYGMQALKPTYEPIIVAQKPYEGRPIDNITQTGAGALNIDAARIAVNPAVDDQRLGGNGKFKTDKSAKNVYEGGYAGIDIASHTAGRWPPNVVLSHTPDCRKVGQQTVPGYTINQFTDGAKPFGDGAGHPYQSTQMPNEMVDVWECVENCPVRILNEQSGTLTSGTGGVKRATAAGHQGKVYGADSRPEGTPNVEYGDMGGAARFFPNFDWNAEAEERLALADSFFYQAKVSKAEANAGLEGTTNSHPTLKPISLNKWLASLLSIPKRYAPRRLLVPCSGVGSEMIGALLATLDGEAVWDEIVGVEMTDEYIPIAEARLAYWSNRQLELPMVIKTTPQTQAPEPEPETDDNQLTLFG